MNIKIKRDLLAIYLLAIAVLITISLISIYFHLPIHFFTRDVTTQANISPFSGVLSNLGIYLWCVAATASFFAAMLLRNRNQTEPLPFLFSSACLTTYLMLDDAFLIHDSIVPVHIGVGEKAVYLVLAIAVLLYLVFFMATILRTNYVPLILAFAFLSSSVVIDSIFESWLVLQIGHWKSIIEDGAKWLGIVSWCIYHVQTAFSFIIQTCTSPEVANESRTYRASSE